MGKVSGDFLRFWGNSGEILEHRGEIFLEGVGHPAYFMQSQSVRYIDKDRYMYIKLVEKMKIS